MADLEKTVAIIFQGIDKDLSTGMKIIGKNFDSLDASVIKLSQPFADAADSILKLDAVMAALVFGGMASAVKESMKMDDALDAVGTTVNLTSDQMSQFKDKIKEYASGSTQSIEAITESISLAVKKGNDWNSSIAITNQAEILAVATRSDLKSATTLLTETINAYGLKASDAAKLTDVFTVAVQQGAGSLPEMADNLGKLTGITSAAGVPIEQVVAAIATLGSMGVDTGSAIAGITKALANMLDPSKECSELAKNLGLDFSASAMSTKGFVGVLKEAYAATGGNAEQMKVLFGSVKGLNVAVDLAKDSNDKFGKSMDALGKSAGVASTIFKEESQDLDKIFQTLKNNFTMLLGDIGDRLTPAVSNISGGITSIFVGLRKGIDAGTFDPIFNYIEKIGKELAEKLKLIAANLPEAMKGLDFSGLITSLDSLGTSFKNAFQAMFGAIDLTTVNDLHLAIQRVIDGFTGLIQVTKGIIDGMKPLFVTIGELINGWESTDAKTKETIGNILGLGKAFNELASHMDIVKGVIALFAASAFTNIIAGISSVSLAITGSLIPALETMVATVATFLTSPVGIAALGVALVAFTGYAIYQKSALDNLASSTQAHAAETNKQTLAMLDAGVASGKMTQARRDELVGQLGLIDGIQKHTDKTRENTAAQQDSIPTIASVTEQIKKTRGEIEKLPLSQKITIGVQADGSTIEKVSGLIVQKFPDGRTMTITNLVDGKKLDEAKAAIEKEIPAEKKLEIQASVDVARIKEQSAVIQSSLEWKAKIDIANIEADAEKIKAMFTSINTTIESTGDTISNLFGSLVGSGGSGWSSSIETQIRQENEYRKEALEIQKELINAQILEISARTTLMNGNKEIGIKISADGLKPHLEAIWYEVLAAIQIRATAEGAQMLIG